jgi:hypothetical protein
MLAMFYVVPGNWNTFWGDLLVFLTFFQGAGSIIHALLIRADYLTRLRNMQQQRINTEGILEPQRHATKEPEIIGLEQNAGGQSPSAVPEGSVSSNSTEAPKQPKRASPSTPAAASKPAPVGSEPSRQLHESRTSVNHVIPPAIGGDELDYQISSSYPFPLAFSFRLLASQVDARDLYREQLRSAENILAFLASVSLALVREEDHRATNIDPAEYWRTGISPGDWKDVVARCSKVFAAYDDNPLAFAIHKLNIRSEKKGFGSDITVLIKEKNDYKHDRGPVVLEDIVTASREAQERLKRCMGMLFFFTEYCRSHG